jgi:hypothetical protein
MATDTNGIAGSYADETFSQQNSIFAGDTPPVATQDILIVAALGAIPQFTPLSFATGAYKLWAVGEEIAAVTAYAIPDSASDQRAAVYVAGMFNIDAIAWPAGTDEAEAHAGSVASQCKFRKLLYSDKRITQSVAAVGSGNESPVTG